MKAVDKYTYQLLKDTEEHGRLLSEDEFDAAISETFTTTLSDLKTVELCKGGADKAVTHKNHKEFIDLVVKTRLNEADKQIGWVKEGMNNVVPLGIFAFLTPRQLEWRVTGNPEITVEALKAITTNAESEHKIVKWFWKMFEGWTQTERRAYLKFVWGRSKIPIDCSNLQYRHCIDVCSHMNK